MPSIYKKARIGRPLGRARRPDKASQGKSGGSTVSLGLVGLGALVALHGLGRAEVTGRCQVPGPVLLKSGKLGMFWVDRRTPVQVVKESDGLAWGDSEMQCTHDAGRNRLG